jgi:KaiC/GvpD/RAD55 family RecA-like ATPase
MVITYVNINITKLKKENLKTKILLNILDKLQIPGLHQLTNKETIPDSIFILTGNMGVGKSVYCRDFYLNGLLNGDYCIYVDCLLDFKNFKGLFPEIENEILTHNSLFINPYKIETADSKKLTEVLQQVTNAIESNKDKFYKNKSRSIRVVIDSITHLLFLFNEKIVEDFIKEMYFLLKINNATGIFTLSIPSINEHVTNRLSCLFDGIIEMRLEDKTNNDNTNSSLPSSSSSVIRKIRILSIKNIGHIPSWIQFEISDDAKIIFGHKNTVNCYLCKEPIENDLIIYSDLPFHSFHLEMYKKFTRLYGINIADIGVSSSEAIHGNFFFIDIVGLSNPSLPVSKQREKIENLNDLIASCDAFKINEENKIILPTGDGMVIGYLVNPELPLQLSIQLHQKLKEYNLKKNNNNQDKIAVRIGLSSGPVFKVNDIKNNPNYWGPGIIYARRVMDIGSNGHILMDNNVAKLLISLKEEYRQIIKPIGEYKIKHGISIELYSVFTKDFGNPELPILSNIIN